MTTNVAAPPLPAPPPASAPNPEPRRSPDAPKTAARRRSAPAALARWLNPLVLRFAGTRLFPLYGVIEHRGRRTGQVFRTPVVVRPTADGFVVPMPWGERTDWYRNVRAAGTCVIRWKGRAYPLAQPEVIAHPAAARAGFNALERAAMGRLGINQALRLRHQSRVQPLL